MPLVSTDLVSPDGTPPGRRKEGGGVRRRKMLIDGGCIASAAHSDKDPVAMRWVTE